MPNLRPGERMQRCESEFHAEIRLQKYYICRTYYTEIEKHFCQGCLKRLEWMGLVRYIGLEGYNPVNTKFETLLNIYGNGIKNGR